MSADPFGLGGILSVVVLTYNRPDELARCLTHLHKLAEQPDLIIVDNTGRPGVTEAVTMRFPDTLVIHARRNLGAAGRNLGVRHATTPFVAFCDDDTWWAPSSLLTAVRILERHPRIGVLNARILVGKEEKADPTCALMSASPLAHYADVGPRLTGFMAGACVMRRRVFLEAGGYWPRFLIGGEESLLAMDILDAGHDIVYAPELVVHHWPSPRRDSALRRDLLLRNAIWTAWLRLPPALAWQQTRHVLGQVHDSKQYARVMAGTLSGIPAVMAHRKTIGAQTLALLDAVWRHSACFEQTALSVTGHRNPP